MLIGLHALAALGEHEVVEQPRADNDIRERSRQHELVAVPGRERTQTRMLPDEVSCLRRRREAEVPVPRRALDRLVPLRCGDATDRARNGRPASDDTGHVSPETA